MPKILHLHFGKDGGRLTRGRPIQDFPYNSINAPSIETCHIQATMDYPLLQLAGVPPVSDDMRFQGVYDVKTLGFHQLFGRFKRPFFYL